jgi:hypothetical protein
MGKIIQISSSVNSAGQIILFALTTGGMLYSHNYDIGGWLPVPEIS